MSRSSRLKLAKGKRYSARIGEGLTIKYRRTEAGFGTWSAKILAADGTYKLKVLGSADDTQEANGVDVLDFWQAQDRSRSLARTAKIDAGIVGRGPPTVEQAIAVYARNRKARKQQMPIKPDSQLTYRKISGPCWFRVSPRMCWSGGSAI